MTDTGTERLLGEIGAKLDAMKEAAEIANQVTERRHAEMERGNERRFTKIEADIAKAADERETLGKKLDEIIGRFEKLITRFRTLLYTVSGAATVVGVLVDGWQSIKSGVKAWLSGA